MNQRRTFRASAALLAGLSIVLGLAAADAPAAPVARMDPPDGMRVKVVDGNRTLSFTDLALSEGGNPAGTVFTVYLDERPKGDLRPLDASSRRWTLTKSTNDEETFKLNTSDVTFVLPATRSSLPPTRQPGATYKGLEKETDYVWRVDVNGAQGTAIRLNPGFMDPGDNSQDVSCYVRFVWDPPGPLPPYAGRLQEEMYLVDLDETTHDGYFAAPVTLDDEGNKILHGENMMHLFDPDEIGDSRMGVREFFHVLDSPYPGIPYPGGNHPIRLLPGRNYAWRIRYNATGGEYFYDTNGNATKDDNENWVWADGGADLDVGWRFRTIPEYSANYFNYAPPVYAFPVVDSEVESLIVYWQSQWGSQARDPEEGSWTFAADAAALKDIHENVHNPSAKTEIVSAEAVVASYGDFHNDSNNMRVGGASLQQVLVPTITGWNGWYTWNRATKINRTHGFPGEGDPFYDGYYESSPVDHYEPWIAEAARTFLQDTTNGYPTLNGGFPVQDDHVSFPNLQYVVILGDGDRVAPSFYYWNETYLPISFFWTPTDFFYATQTSAPEVAIDPRFQVSRIPLKEASVGTEQPVITKIRDYAELLNSNGKKDLAFQDWFGRAVFVSGSRHWFQWYQMFPGFAQYLLGQRVDVGGGRMRDIFSGMQVRKFDLFSTGSEALTPANILSFMRNSDPADTPGFVYLLCQGYSWGSTGGDDFGHIYNSGERVNLTPSDFPESFETATFISDADFPRTFPGAVDGRRPVLVDLAACGNRFDNQLWATLVPDTESIGMAGVLGFGGPIASVGFANGYYHASDSWTRELDSGTQQLSLGPNIDISEGHQYLKLDKGVLRLEKDGNPDAAVLGKMELIKLFAREYGSTTQPGLGNIFNKALATYVTTHSAELLADDMRVAPQVFGFSLMGDCALFLPQIQPAVKDNVRPVLTDMNPRTGTVVTGIGATPRYNSQEMPIHTIPRTDPYDANIGAPVTMKIETDAPAVRVRTMAPFLNNSTYTSGGWFSTTEVTENSTQIFPTVNGSYTYTFNAKSPSVFFLVVQAQNPAWTAGVDDPEWRWLQERWIYVQSVNQFVRDPQSNIAAVDMDQSNRFHLGRYQDAEHTTVAGFEQDVEDYYINPARDGLGYVEGVEDPRNFPLSPTLPVLNNEAGLTPAYRYMYWCGNPYETSAINAVDIKAGQRYYGEITPALLKSFLDSRGVVIRFGGDFARPTSEGYMVLFAPVEEDEANFIQSFVTSGGRFFMSEQSVLDQVLTVTGAANYTPFATGFLQTALSVAGRVLDTDLTNMDGLRIGTLSELIRDVDIAGGDGANNATATGEIDPDGLEALSVFTWDVTSGPPGPTPPESTVSCAVQSRLAASGGRTVFFTFPVDAIDHVGDLGVDDSGREFVVKSVIDWLRSVPKAVAPDPADGAIGVSLSKTLSWGRVPEAAHYRIYLGTNQATFTDGPGVVVDRDNPRYTPPGGLTQNTRYYWRVDTRNVDDYTIGDIWTFNTVAPAPQAANPVPANGLTQVPLDQLLSWAQDSQVDTYDITIWQGAVAPGNIYSHEQFMSVAQYLPVPRLNPNQTYYWRVDSRNELGTVTGIIWSFSTITPPPVPTNPDPADPVPNNSATGSTNVPTNKVFGWNATSRTDEYHVFVWPVGDAAPGTDTSPIGFNRWSGISTTNSYSPGELTANTTFNWQVRPSNEAGRQNSVDTWSFTTSVVVANPLGPTNPYPADGAAGIGRDPTLTWSRAPGAFSYDIFFWIQGSPVPGVPTASDLADPSFTPPSNPLTIGETYSWRVIAKNSLGSEASGPIWSFTVGAAKVTGMVPADGAIAVIPSITFQWDDSAGAASYNVYLAQGSVLPGTPTVNVTDSEYKPPVDLVLLSSYIWRVDAISPAGDVTQGDPAQFTTGTASGVPDQVTGMNPADGAVNVSVNVTLRWSPAAGAASYRLYLGAGVLPAVPTATGLVVTQYKPAPALLGLTTYRWRVDAVGPDGVTVTTGLEIAFTTADPNAPPPGGGGGGSCFIATAAYEGPLAGFSGVLESNCTGTYALAPERLAQLNDIRGLRNDMLLNVAVGRGFSAWYYAVGPYAAEAIRDREPAKAAVRAALLDPLSALSRECREKEGR